MTWPTPHLSFHRKSISAQQLVTAVGLTSPLAPAVLGTCTAKTCDTLLTFSIKKPINTVKATFEADEGRAASAARYRHARFGIEFFKASRVSYDLLCRRPGENYRASKTGGDITDVLPMRLDRHDIPAVINARPVGTPTILLYLCDLLADSSDLTSPDPPSSFDHMLGRGP